MKRQSHLNRGNAGRSQSAIAIVITMIVVGIISSLLFLRRATESRDYAHALICASNVKLLGIAIAEFAHEHNGKLPEKLEDISPYGGSNKTFVCPSARDKSHFSYVLTGATNVWGVSTNTVILLEVEPNHYGGHHVLLDDGRVELRVVSDH